VELTTAAPTARTRDPSGVAYTGLLTRGIAFAIDAALINLVALVVTAGATLIVSLFHLPSNIRAVIAAVGVAAYVVWVIGYFVGFWSATGQTPGNRVMQFRVLTSNGERLRPRRALLRCGALVIAALPLFAGFLLTLFDRQRRGLQDRLARTVVVEAPGLSLAEASRRRRRTSARRAIGSEHAGADHPA